MSKQAITNDDVRNVLLQMDLPKDEIATNSDRQMPTIWNWLNNRTNVPAFAIPTIVNATDNSKPLDILCKACGHIAVPEIEIQKIEEDIRKLEANIAIDEGKFFSEVEKALEPDSPGGVKIIRPEAKRIISKGISLIKKTRALMLLIEEKGRV